MAIVEHKIVFRDDSTAGDIIPAGWLDAGFAGSGISGVVLSDMNGSGLNFEVIDSFTSAGKQSWFDQDHHGIPVEVWRRGWFTTQYATNRVKVSGFTPGKTGSIFFFGANDSDSRYRILSINGGPEYINDVPDSLVEPFTPQPPTEVPFTADANGEIELLYASSFFAAFFAGTIIQYDDGTATPASLTAPETVTPAEASSFTITGDVTVTALTLTDGAGTETQTLGARSYDAGGDLTTYQFTAVQGNLPFGTGYTLEATLSDTSTVSGTTDLVVADGNAAVNVVDPVTTENSVYHEATSPNADTPETNDQVEHTDAANTTVAADGTITQAEVRNFEARFWSITDRTWGAMETISPFDVDAVVSSIGMTRRNITRRAFTRRAQTSRGMTS